MKKYYKSAVTYIFYVAAVLLVAYAIWEVVAVCKEISAYYAQVEGMNGKLSEYLSYSLQAGLQYVVWGFAMFGFGFGINETRKLNSAYYRSKEDIEQVKAAKEEVKKAKAKVNSLKTDYESMTKQELYDLAKEKGLKVTTKTTKAELVKLLEE